MTTPIKPQKHINSAIYTAIRRVCIDLVDKSQEAKDLYAEFDRLMGTVKGKMPLKDWNNIHDMFIAAACTYGDEMFRMGITLGSDPSAILDLPDEDGDL
jgi:hypothetical protein